MSTVSPQGYQIENNPVNNNPFWEYEIEGSGLKSIECTKTTQGDFDYYAWSYTDADDISHHVMTQVVSTKAGEDGVTFTPSVSNEGVISWTNDGGLPNPSPVSIRGPQGIQGIQGIQGPQGPAGPAGATGARGPQGVPGEPGQDGADGLDGTSPSIEVTEITGGYQLTIIDAYGTHTVNILDGTDGTPGAAATVNIGTVTTGQPGSSATVVNSGTPNAAVLDFSIPQGQTGATGATGPAGQDGSDGADGVSPEVTITPITGGNTVTITDADHPTGQSFNVMDGQDGMGTVTVGTTTTGAAGTQASVTNSGTAQDAILNFTIPQGAQGIQGEQGPQGETGATGATGPQGPQGETGATGATGPQGPAGQGVPTGGTAGQVLAKVDGTDYNTEWVTPSGGGGSGKVSVAYVNNRPATAPYTLQANSFNQIQLTTPLDLGLSDMQAGEWAVVEIYVQVMDNSVVNPMPTICTFMVQKTSDPSWLYNIYMYCTAASNYIGDYRQPQTAFINYRTGELSKLYAYFNQVSGITVSAIANMWIRVTRN